MSDANTTPTTGLQPDGSTIVVENAPAKQPDPAPPAAPAGNGERMLSWDEVQELLGKARTEEKDKLYNRLNKTEEELKALKVIADADAKAKAEAEKAAAKAAKAAEEAEMSAKELLERRQAEWEREQKALADQFTAFKTEAEQQQAAWEAHENERALRIQLDDYRNQLLSANAHQLVPQLAGYVYGNSFEELDAALGRVLADSAAIIQDVQAAHVAPPQGPGRGPSVTAPPMGPLEQQTVHETFTEADIKAMSPREYEANRDKILGAIRRSPQRPY